MNLRKVDLNLLVTFDALMQTHHITRAGQLLGIGQPAMSAALSRLRYTFNDDLFVKQGGEMKPTPRAVELAPEIKRVLRDIEHLLTDEDGFDPKTSNRRFTVRMSDLLAHLILPPLMANLQASAPHIEIETRHLSPDATMDALDRDDIELAVSMELTPPKSVMMAPLFDDRVVTVVRSDHKAKSRLSRLDVFLEQKHVRVAQSPIDHRFALEIGSDSDTNEGRSIALTVPHWLSVADIVSISDLVAVIPESIAGVLSQSRDISIVDTPFSNDKFRWHLYWHRRYQSDPSLRWLREQMIDATSGLGNSHNKN